MTWYMLPIMLTLLIFASILWGWRRSGRIFCHPLPRPFRDRQSQESTWRQAYPEKMFMADALLRTLCEAFNFNADHRYRFAPTDRLMDVYRDCYPRWKFWNIGDNLEIESLLVELSQQFAVDGKDWYTETTLGEIVGMMQPPLENRRNPENEEQSSCDCSKNWLFRRVYGRFLWSFGVSCWGAVGAPLGPHQQRQSLHFVSSGPRSPTRCDRTARATEGRLSDEGS